MKDLEKIEKSNCCITAQQFDYDSLKKICELTDKIRVISETKEGRDWLQTLLSDKKAMLYFAQPSSRTFMSFVSACHILGIKIMEIRDPSISSMVKGESDIDSFKTFSQFADLIIMRHDKSNLIYEVADALSKDNKIINAGSGADQHPTQALLDVYTIYKMGFNNKKIAFVGDLARGRTVRSLALMLSKLPKEEALKFYFVAPSNYQIKDDILEQLKKENIDYELTDNWEELMSKIDIVYMTRLQNEHDKKNWLYYLKNKLGISPDNARSNYIINKNNINKLKPDCKIMHPLPRRLEIGIEVDKDNRAVYWEQVENGMWVRVALIALLFKKEKQINNQFLNYQKIKKI